MSLIQFCAVTFVLFVTTVTTIDYYYPTKHISNETFVGQEVKDILLLDFRGCSVETVSNTAFDDLINLNDLLLSTNDIETLPDDVFNKLKNIQIIRLRGNKLKHISKKLFSKLNILNMIDLAYNFISTIEIGAFDNDIKLQTINLKSNRLTKIPVGIFNNLKELNHLDIGDNLIYNIDDSALPNFQKLRTLMIYSNKLQHLNKKHVELLTTLSLDKNPWFCDCNLKEVHAKWQTTFKHDGWSPICNAPKKLHNVRWDKLTSDDFVCHDINLHIYPEYYDITAEIGRSISLNCYVTGQANASDIKWTNKKNKEITDVLKDADRSFTVQSFTVQFNTVQKNKFIVGKWYNITINKVISSDDGLYKCVAHQGNQIYEVEKRVLVVNATDFYNLIN